MFSTNQTRLTKEDIASRMFRNAARFWGLNDTDMANFDPLVRLLVEACALEVYRIDNEIATLQGTMTERMAALLIPEVHVQPRPAHAVIHAAATDDLMYVALESQFKHQKRVASVPNGPLDSSVDLFFSPAGRYKTISGDAKLIAATGCMHKLNELQQKETLFRSEMGRSLPAQTLWLGIEARRGHDLTELPLFFDLKNTPDKGRYFAMLRHVRCFIGGKQVQLVPGLLDARAQLELKPFEDSLEELYINRRLEKQVARLYATQFLTIESKGNEFLKSIDPALLENCPGDLAEYFNAADQAQLKNKLLWIRIEFPSEFNPQILDDLSVAINCFPVVNRRLNGTTYRLNNYFNIIPLLTSEQFCAVKKVEGTVVGKDGRNDYVYHSFDQYTEGDKGTYTVRTGDLERFDSRNAVEYLNNLVELLRDESRAFAAFGQGFMPTAIKELSQNVGLIEQKIRQNQRLLETSPSYLLINPLQEGDTIFVQFWSCNGDAGNGIRSGSKMDLYEGASFRKEGLVLMTQTAGGMDKLKNTEVLTAFKSALLSRNRIVTAADVKNFCAAYLQKPDLNIQVGPGVALSPMPEQGLVPVIDVLIRSEEQGSSPQEWERLKIELTSELEHGSPAGTRYQIRVESV